MNIGKKEYYNICENIVFNEFDETKLSGSQFLQIENYVKDLEDKLLLAETDNFELATQNIELLEALTHADEEICLVCKELNPQHKECTLCEEREHRTKLIEKLSNKKTKES